MIKKLTCKDKFKHVSKKRMISCARTDKSEDRNVFLNIEGQIKTQEMMSCAKITDQSEERKVLLKITEQSEA